MTTTKTAMTTQDVTYTRKDTIQNYGYLFIDNNKKIELSNNLNVIDNPLSEKIIIVAKVENKKVAEIALNKGLLTTELFYPTKKGKDNNLYVICPDPKTLITDTLLRKIDDIAIISPLMALVLNLYQDDTVITHDSKSIKSEVKVKPEDFIASLKQICNILDTNKVGYPLSLKLCVSFLKGQKLLA